MKLMKELIFLILYQKIIYFIVIFESEIIIYYIEYYIYYIYKL